MLQDTSQMLEAKVSCLRCLGRLVSKIDNVMHFACLVKQGSVNSVSDRSDFGAYMMHRPMWGFCTVYSWSLVDFGGTQSARSPHDPKCSKFHAVFCKIWQIRMLAPPSGTVGSPPLGILDPPRWSRMETDFYTQQKLITFLSKCIHWYIFNYTKILLNLTSSHCNVLSIELYKCKCNNWHVFLIFTTNM